MSPAPSPNFETLVRNRLSNLLASNGAEIVVDEAEWIEDENVLLIAQAPSRWNDSPAGFSFPFHQTEKLDRSLSALKDMVLKNWDRAHIAPPVVERTSRRTAFAD